jgi:release factor glutamine methyltransferase
LTVVAVDAAREPVDLTAANAIHHGVTDRVSVVEASAHAFLESKRSSGFAGVVCNPPYIATGELTALPREVCEHEPMLALDGGPDGLDFYRKVVPLLARCLHANGFVMFEIGDTQAAPVSALLQDAGFNAVDVAKDYAGCDRVVTASRAGARHG